MGLETDYLVVGRTVRRWERMRCARGGPSFEVFANRDHADGPAPDRLDWLVDQLRIDPPDPDRLARDIMATLTRRGLLDVDPGRTARD